MKQFDGVLKTFVNETNKFEYRFGNIRDEDKMLAVKKLMLESLQNFRFCGVTMSYDELLIAVQNIIIDKAATAPTVGGTSPPMEIGMAAKDEGENSRRRRSTNYGLRVASRIQRDSEGK